MEKDHILGEIRRTAAENGGKPLGRSRFFQQTGIKDSDWLGKLWPRWSAAVEEAGFFSNGFQGRKDRETSLKKLAELTRSLSTFPTVPEMRLHKRTDSSFLNSKVLLGTKGRSGLIIELLEFCSNNRGYEDVEAICRRAPIFESRKANAKAENESLSLGYVYMLASGKKYKIGYSKAALTRASTVSGLTPDGSEIIHLIRTDDMRGIEAYWHNRFSEKRGNGEWFALSAADVAAFKRRKFM
jgi:hypothetical protein